MSLIMVLSALVVTCALTGVALVAEMRRWRRDRLLHLLLVTYGPAAGRALQDPRELLVWYPLVRGARQLFPKEFAALDAATARDFPFPAASVQAAHARWTAEWLAWERTHDDEYKLKASALEEELERQGAAGTAVGRGRLAAVEREKFERNQQRYQEYVEVAKALTALEPGGTRRKSRTDENLLHSQGHRL